ncbi:MAG: YfcC family protein, partial [Massilia sp.]
MKLRIPNTFVLLFLILAVIAISTWFVPGGQYDTLMVDGKPRINPDSFHYVASNPQGFVALMMAPIKGFVAAAEIIGFVLIVGGAFAVLQGTNAIDSMIKSVAKAHGSSRFVRAMMIPVFVTMFSLGGATFGMSEETIPFILIFVPLALALGYDSIVGVAIPFVSAQVGFAAAFLNPFNVAVAQGIAGVEPYSGVGYRLIVWFIANAITIAFLMWYAARIKRTPTLSPTYALDLELRKEKGVSLENFAGMTRTHGAVLAIFLGFMTAMVFGVVRFEWGMGEIAALFLVMAMAVGVVGRLNSDQFVADFIHGAKDLVTTALVIALARGTMILARDAHVIDTMLHALMPLVQSSSPIFAAQK